MTREIKPLPPELTRLLFDAGPRKIVLVEGPDDRDALREWYMERLGEVEFYHAEAGMGTAHVVNVKRGLRKDHFRNLLAHAVNRLGIHNDIAAIVERRILR